MDRHFGTYDDIDWLGDGEKLHPTGYGEGPVRDHTHYCDECGDSWLCEDGECEGGGQALCPMHQVD